MKLQNSEAVVGGTTEKTKSLTKAITEVTTGPLIEQLNSLQETSDKLSFAQMIIESTNAIDEMKGIWEDGKQILGEKAIAIHDEIVNNGLEPDKDGFYKLANGQMVQYGKGIEDYEDTLKSQAKRTLDSALFAGIQEMLPEQLQIGWDMGGYFIDGYTEAFLGRSSEIEKAYNDALKKVDTATVKEQAKKDGNQIGQNTGLGLIKGVNSTSSLIAYAVKQMMEKSVKETAENAVDSHSPSKWFQELAVFCGQGFNNGLEPGFQSVFSFFNNFGSRISNTIGKLNYIGHNAIIGINNGMVEASETLYNNARQIAQNISGIFRDTLKIHSPSKVMEELGGYTCLLYTSPSPRD